jgi:signal transduction histidine kinase/DNA-binding response OmpR family regulator
MLLFKFQDLTTLSVRRIFIVLWLQLVLCTFLLSQNYNIRTFEFNRELSNRTITSLFQDSSGIIWIGTLLGLNSFDGRSVKSYVPNLKNSWALRGSQIIGINQDKEGLIWISMDEGLAVMDPLTERCINLPDFSKIIEPVTTGRIIFDQEGIGWCNHYVNGKTEICKIYPPKDLKSLIRNGRTNEIKFKIDVIPVPKDFGLDMKYFRSYDRENLLTAGSNGKFYLLNTSKSEFSKINIEDYAQVLKDNSLIIPVKENVIYTVRFPGYDFNSDYSLSYINEILKTADHKYLLFNYYNKKIFDVTNSILSNSELDFSKMKVWNEISDNLSLSRLIDQRGNIWMGTIGSGLYVATFHEGYNLSAPDEVFYNLEDIGNEMVWQGIFGKDKVYDINSKKVIQSPWKGILNNNQKVLGVKKMSGSETVFMMTRNGESPVMQLVEFNYGTNKINYTNIKMEFQDAPQMIIDNKGFLWIAGKDGELLQVNINSKKTKRWNVSDYFSKNLISLLEPRSITSDASGNLFISYDAGFIHVLNSAAKPVFSSPANIKGSEQIFENRGFSYAYPDPTNKDILWMATQGGGLCKFNTTTLKAQHFKKAAAYFYDVNIILPDKFGNIWLSTDKGIFCFNIKLEKFISFANKEIFRELEFNVASGCILQDGKLAFGTWNGLLIISPEELLQGVTYAPILLSQCQINGISFDADLHTTGKEDSHGITLNLHHSSKNIFLKFSSPNSLSPRDPLLEFRIKDIYNDWTPIGSQGSVMLSGLSSGSYVLEVRHADNIENDQNVSVYKVEIHISYAWYNHPVMWVIYFILLILVAKWVFDNYRKQISNRYEAELREREVSRLEILNQFRKRFTSYLVHEFKTPLTLIIGMAELLKMEKQSDTETEYTNTIQKEGNEMLGLIGEMIDIIKLEDGTLQLKYEATDLNIFIKNIISGFKNIARLKDINIALSAPEEPVIASIDQTWMKFILNNLLDNALRFTNNGGTISLILSAGPQSLFQIVVRDTGIGIPASKLKHIFDPYYKVDETSANNKNFGLGLAFVKEITSLHQGSIEVESKTGKGSSFTLSFPSDLPVLIRNKDISQINDWIETDESEDENFNTYSIQDKPLLLICDDNINVLSFLENIMGNHYNVIKAMNGTEGLAKAEKLIPDLVLTDVVMPIKDGVEMTAALKVNPLTSHIPVVILSGQGEIEDRLKGQEAGADAYLLKPFNHKEVLLTLNNLYERQQKWKKHYSDLLQQQPADTFTSAGITTSVINTMDQTNEQFLKLLYDVFEENYTIDGFDSNALCRSLHISKTQLYRKLASISDESPMEMLRNFRLEKARGLLISTSDLSIQEIANKSGFKERTHFNALFLKRYGMSPTDMRRNKS